MNKSCPKCKAEKDVSLFNKRWSNKTSYYSYASYCRDCSKKDNNARYAANKAKFKKSSKDFNSKRRRWLADYLADKSCLDCGETDPVVLVFDHRDPSTKVAGISAMVIYAFDKVLEEIAKCDIVCANCHARRTAEMQKWQKLDGSDGRNIVDEYKGKEHAEIVADLAQKRRPYAIMLINTDYDLNLGNCIRTLNAFSGTEIFIYGKKRWDRRAAVGTHCYEKITFIKEEDNILDFIGDYTPVGLDNIDGSKPLPQFVWPEKPLIVVGNESSGLSLVPEIARLCKEVVHVPQSGSVRSLNMAVAAGISIYDLIIKRGWYEQ